jgi:F0F1-type ATP synthase epsilon subunit
VTINEDSSVQILAEEAHKVEDLDITAARWGRVYMSPKKSKIP